MKCVDVIDMNDVAALIARPIDGGGLSFQKFHYKSARKRRDAAPVVLPRPVDPKITKSRKSHPPKTMICVRKHCFSRFADRIKTLRRDPALCRRQLFYTLINRGAFRI